jgi:hypothetical protein
MDNIDIDYTLENYSTLLNNNPKIIRSTEALAAIRQQRQQQQAQAQAAQQAEQYAASAKNLAATDVGGGQNALQSMLSSGGGTPGV